MTHGRTIIKHKPFQKGLLFKEEVMFLFIMDQCCKEDMASDPSLDIFLLPPTQSSFQKGKSINYHSITSLSDGGPIKFKVSGSGKGLLDLARSYLFLKVKVTKAYGSNLDGASKVGFANYPVASLFNQMDVIFGW